MVDAREELRIGVDLGGTKVEAAVIRVRAGAPEFLSRERVPTEREQGYDHVLGQALRAVSLARVSAGVDGALPVGVGMPGSTTRRRADGSRSPVPLIKNSNTTCLNGRPFRDDLAAALGGAAVAFSNDANCFTLAEACFGAARGARVAFGVILGTGVGGGIAFADPAGAVRVWDGLQGLGGEWGHVTLDPSGGPPCYCGRRGCIEQYLSGPALEARYVALGGASTPLADLWARRDADALARTLFDEAAERFGRALATVVNVLDPDVVVLGGGVSKLPLFYDAGVEALGRWAFTDVCETPVRQHALGDSAGVLGAAMLT